MDDIRNDILTLIDGAFLKLFKKLEEKNVKFSTMKAIELFSRDGTLHTKYYANKIASLDAWEIDTQWELNYKKIYRMPK
jgi:hypothetical protein